MTSMAEASVPAFGSALGIAASAIAVAPFVDPGPLSAHMALHIATMNVAAPLVAIMTCRLSQQATSARRLWAATLAQIVMLWLWHLPSAHHLAAASSAGAVAAQASLFAAALWFWDSLLRLRSNEQWQGIIALLITGKLACLLAGLLVFSTRPIFHHHGASASLDDQHLAGLLMIVACPASYVLAGVIMAIRFVGILKHKPPLVDLSTN